MDVVQSFGWLGKRSEANSGLGAAVSSPQSARCYIKVRCAEPTAAREDNRGTGVLSLALWVSSLLTNRKNWKDPRQSNAGDRTLLKAGASC